MDGALLHYHRDTEPFSLVWSIVSNSCLKKGSNPPRILVGLHFVVLFMNALMYTNVFS